MSKTTVINLVDPQLCAWCGRNQAVLAYYKKKWGKEIITPTCNECAARGAGKPNVKLSVGVRFRL